MTLNPTWINTALLCLLLILTASYIIMMMQTFEMFSRAKAERDKNYAVLVHIETMLEQNQ